MTTGKIINPAPVSVPFNAADLLRADDLPGFLTELLADGDSRALPLGLRTAADVLGMAELSRRTGLNRETLYRTLSAKGNPRLDTLAAILGAFDLRLSVRAIKPARGVRTGKNPRAAVAKKQAEPKLIRRRA